jgi:hypothetical protein
MVQLDTRFRLWRKASASEGNESACVEVGFSTNAVGVRDTKNREAGTLAFDRRAWSAFLDRRG